MFRKLSLLWPDHWPDSTPPLWGDRYFIGGDYNPRYLGKLADALPRMPALTKLHMSCPFYPPDFLFEALVKCPSIRSLSISDTPLYKSAIPRVPPEFHLEHLSLVPVGEAMRIGEGPYDAKYQDQAYYNREYRKRYRNDSLARYAAEALLFNFAKASALRCVQLSGDICTFYDLSRREWPNLETLILTGHAPRLYGRTELVDVVAKMPKLADLRLLFATVKNDPLFPIMTSSFYNNNHSTFTPIDSTAASSSSSTVHTTAEGTPATVLSQLRHLAVSNACQLSGAIFHYANRLERLVICAISDLPRVPVALSRVDVNTLMNNFGVLPSAAAAPAGGGSSSSNAQADGAVGSASGAVSEVQPPPYRSLKQLRIMIEDKANPELCHALCALFPELETLEVERCTYHDGKPIHEWREFVAAMMPVEPTLKELRLCIQFPEFDEADRVEPWRNARRECAAYFAARMHGLQKVGFEYRRRTGTHRYEDGWLEFQVETREEGKLETAERQSSLNRSEGQGHERIRDVKLVELPSSWYRCPEVWTPEYIVS